MKSQWSTGTSVSGLHLSHRYSSRAIRRWCLLRLPHHLCAGNLIEVHGTEVGCTLFSLAAAVLLLYHSEAKAI